MDNKLHKNYFLVLWLLHLAFGFIIYNFKAISFAYSAAIIIIGTYQIINNKNKNNEVLFWAGYVVAAEVFLRMAKGNIGNEFGKYCVIIFSLLGIYFNGFSKRALVYILFLIFLIPGAIYGAFQLGLEFNVRKAIVFNLLGAISLGISSIYFIDKQFTIKDINKLTQYMLLPLSAMTIYVLLYNPSIREVITGTDSNAATSGGFGPNQVSTVFGLAMFLAFARFLLFSKTLFWQVFHLILLTIFTFRGFITFSRGGVITGIVMIVSLVLFTYPKINIKGKAKIGLTAIILAFLGLSIFIYGINQSGGMLLNRYKGEDALGRTKSSKFSGREELAETEISMFLNNPITGIGVGKSKESRIELLGLQTASHSEITRMLSEHGLLGVIDLIILFVMPFFVYFASEKNNIFLLSFFLFWLLTINHAAMRIAAPAFIYSLSLLRIDFTNSKEQ